MKTKTVVRASAVVSTLAILTLSGSPALAAAPIAQASATGASITVAGQSNNTGTYAVTNDGTKETVVSGSNQPSLALLGGQNAVKFGTLAQDAKTTVDLGDGKSIACAGAAGNGASLAAVGSGTTCLSGGNNVDISAGTLDLRNLTLSPNPALAPLNAALQQVVGPVGTALNTATTQLFNALGNPAVVLSLGALQSSCMSDPTSASGTANLANAGAYVDLPALGGQPKQRVNLLTFPVNPDPNTKVVTGLDKVTTKILDALRLSLNTTATGPLAGLKTAIDAIDATVFANLQSQLVEGVIGQIAPQLKPLEDNIIDGTLNKQFKPSANSIEVTALELNVLPVATQQLKSAALSLMIGKSTCGPNGRLVAPKSSGTPKDTKPNNNNGNGNNNPPNNTPVNAPNVPTSVPAGLADAPTANAPLGPVALAGLGGLMALSVATGAAVYRRNARS